MDSLQRAHLKRLSGTQRYTRPRSAPLLPYEPQKVYAPMPAERSTPTRTAPIRIPGANSRKTKPGLPPRHPNTGVQPRELRTNGIAYKPEPEPETPPYDFYGNRGLPGIPDSRRKIAYGWKGGKSRRHKRKGKKTKKTQEKHKK